MISLAVDAMGGDYAPRNIIEGVGLALDSDNAIGNVFLTGDRSRIEEELKRIGKQGNSKIEIVHCDQVVEMNEAPATAIRKKPESSIARAVDLVKEGKAQAIVSAGHTGAAVASSVLKLRPQTGMERPAIATLLPRRDGGRFLLLDAGASVDCRSKHLAQFAVMGETYSRCVRGIENPRIGLLNIGEENSKGNETLKETYALMESLKDKGLNFVGNVEGNVMFDGLCDVVVCDGFTGNIALKCGEGTAKFITGHLKEYLKKTWIRRLGALFSRRAFLELKAVADQSEYGGAPLLGVNGVCIISHGCSCPNAIANALRVAEESVEQQVSSNILDRIRELRLDNGAR